MVASGHGMDRVEDDADASGKLARPSEPEHFS